MPRYLFRENSVRYELDNPITINSISPLLLTEEEHKKETEIDVPVPVAVTEREGVQSVARTTTDKSVETGGNTNASARYIQSAIFTFLSYIILCFQ